MSQEKVLSVNNLAINFKTDNGILKAVRDISFDLNRGETLCIVGESGSGKSVTSKAIMGILANNAIIESGNIMYRGENLLEVSEDEFYKIRGHKIGMIFQDPLSSLNPIVRIGKQITEAMLINSDKLKIMYSDLISDDRQAVKERKLAFKEFEKKTRESYGVRAKELKAVLEETEKKAKQQVKEYKEKVTSESKARLAGLEKRLAAASSEEEKSGIKKEIEEEKLDLTNRLNRHRHRPDGIP